jgi:hypothetical protein
MAVIFTYLEDLASAGKVFSEFYFFTSGANAVVHIAFAGYFKTVFLQYLNYLLSAFGVDLISDRLFNAYFHLLASLRFVLFSVLFQAFSVHLYP